MRLALLASLLLASFPSHAAQDPLAGVWRSVGYADLLVVDEMRFTLYGETASSRIERARGTRSGTVLTFETEPGTAVLTLAGDELSLWRNDHTVGRRFRRTGDRAVRPTPATQDPYANLQVAWEAFNENYPFFELRGVDWREQYERARARLRPEMSGDELFAVLSDMISSLGNDGHAWLRKEGRSFSGASVEPHPLRGRRPDWQKLVREKYLGNAVESLANGKVLAGTLRDGTRYVAVVAVAGFAETDEPGANIAAFGDALDRVLGRLRPGEPLVVDIRINGGGYDDYSLLAAGRLTDRPRVAFLKQPRIQGTEQYGPLAVRLVFPASGPHATGPVLLLTSGLTYSGAEIFAMATMQFPSVTRIGEPTAGALSDVLEFRLPNGWTMGVSNERYFAPDGVCYETRGVPPHVAARMTVEELDAGVDPGLEAAMKHVATTRSRPR
jgi:hypothetical protein